MLRRLSLQVPRHLQSPVHSAFCPKARQISNSLTRMAATHSHLQPPISTPHLSESFQLLSTAQKTGEAEDALFDHQVADGEAWWKTPPYEGFRRPYTAQDVVSKRGSLQTFYSSAVQGIKLFTLLCARA